MPVERFMANKFNHSFKTRDILIKCSQQGGTMNRMFDFI